MLCKTHRALKNLENVTCVLIGLTVAICKNLAFFDQNTCCELVQYFESIHNELGCREEAVYCMVTSGPSGLEVHSHYN